MNTVQILETLKRLKDSPLKEGSHLFPEFKGIPIGEAVEKWKQDQTSSAYQPAIIFLRVVLSANRNFNKHVRGNIERILVDYPELTSFESLQEFVGSMSKEQFYEFWGHKNLKKYNVLKNLLEAVVKLRSKYGIQDDTELMQKWAQNVDLENYKKDPIGSIHNIAIATIQHLRIDFGIKTVKPDQRVIEVLKREFKFEKVSPAKAIRLVEEIAEIAGISVRKLDLIFVNYGSGYYDNRVFDSQKKLRMEIAKKLEEHEVSKEIIFYATGIRLKTN